MNGRLDWVAVNRIPGLRTIAIFLLAAGALITSVLVQNTCSDPLNGRVLVVQNIQELKNIGPSERSLSVFVLALGYRQPGDGGEGFFYFDDSFKGPFDQGTAIKSPDTVKGGWKRIYSGPVNVKWFGAIGDGIADDTDAMTAALRKSYIYLPDGTFLVKDQLEVNASISGPGRIIYKESGFNPQQIGSAIYAGSYKSRGGEKRVHRKGGLYIGGSAADPRGIQLHTEENSAWGFLKESSPYGQSLLFSLQPNPLTVHAATIRGTGRVTAQKNDFSSENWAVDDLVQFNKSSYRIGSIKNRHEIVLVNNNKKRSKVLFDASITDNLIQPAFYFECVGNVSGNRLSITGGDAPPPFSKWDYRHDRVMALINGHWIRINGSGGRYQYQLAASPGDGAAMKVRLKLQPEYAVQFSLKRTSGQGLEETWFIRSDADAWRYRSTGSGVAENKPHVFQVGNRDVFSIDEQAVTSSKDLIVHGISKMQEVLPAKNNTFSIGGRASHWQSVYSEEIRPGNGSVVWTSGTGSPEGRIAASAGSIYTRTDGGPGKTLYIKETGSNAYGWKAK